MNDDKKEEKNINEMLITHLRNISHTMRSLYEGKGSQKRVLMILNENEKMTQHMLTKKLGIKPSSVSEVISKLENAHYITRLPNQTDKRTTNIILTPQGKIQAIEALAQRNQRHEDMFSCLSDHEKTQLLILLEKVNNDWKKYQNSKSSQFKQ